tara:strand:- start:6045 stop:6599 length:555 start_codon:yes stop_codon:yes gene_type:complete
MTENNIHEEYLTTDVLQVPNQKYALVSFVSPDSKQKHNNLAMKIRGVFPTVEEAREHSGRIMKKDKWFDVYVVEMYNWVLIPPNPEEITDQQHQDEMLNTMVKEYRHQQDSANEMFEERKREMINNANENTEKQKEKNAAEEAARNSDLAENLNDKDVWMSRKEEESSRGTLRESENEDMEKVD